MNPWIVVPVLGGIAILYVMLPVGIAVYTQFRRRKLLSCPVKHRDASIRVDAVRASLTACVGAGRPRVAECSLSPRNLSCEQQCLGLPVSAMRDAPATTLH